jgi:uncharacterized protein YggU (UPF0235/DUF167 family)
MDAWRYSTEGISVALRVTPRGGRDDIDGLETLANGRTVVKVRVSKRDVRVTSGATSRLKQIAVDGDPQKLGEMLRKLTAAKPA